jgi:capsular polysaccharide biosynthesis protein
MFRSAAAVLAPHGAALTSMLHCPTGSAIFEFMHSSNVNRMWFMIMAAKLGLNYWNVSN